MNRLKSVSEMIRVMQAHARGQAIEAFDVYRPDLPWGPIKCPNWDWQHYDYRIKPAERKPREFLVYPKDLLARGILLPINCGYDIARKNGMMRVREVLPE